MDVRPLQSADLAEASHLLARRHRKHREDFPELPPQAESAEFSGALLSEMLLREGCTGWGAFAGGKLLAYLIGEIEQAPLWGRSGWIRECGSAWAGRESIPALAELYARQAQAWIRTGRFAHFATPPASDPDVLRLWFGLAFGIEHVHAVLDLRSISLPQSSLPEGIEIRLATLEDQEALLQMSDVVWRHQLEAPVWAIMLPENAEANRSGWLELLADSTVDVWLAFDRAEVVGCQAYYPSERIGEYLLGGDSTCHLAIAGTRTAARRRGIASALTCTGLAQARERGFEFSETDWRSTNLLSSRFWPRFGFRPAFYRLARRIDERIAWAGGQG
jgi:ribosomal protein S18 acetylase RimI-like enzyme